jgi:hypothetical protein
MPRMPTGVAPPWLLLVAGLIVLAGLTPVLAAAQSVTGTITGTISDASGAGVAGTRVALTHVSTGLVRTLAADERGVYAAPLLAPGTYTLTAEALGFRLTSIAGLRLGVDERVHVDVTLEIGALTDAVTVQADNAVVQRSSSELSATLGEAQILGLPLSGRNFVQLARTMPGVTRGVPGENVDGAGSLAWRHTASLSANGQRPRDNNFLLDGLDNNEVWLNTVAVFPSVDALDEMKVQTGVYSAEFGRSLGAVVSLQTKSGANVPRGSAFEFVRDGRLDANDWFLNRAGRPRPDFTQHQFGATLGGPLVKNRTFFFADYQGRRSRQGLSLLSTVPSDAMRGGDFSEVNRAIYDPVTQLPFPGNVIPSARVDSVARRIVEQLYPRANTAGRRAENGQPIDNYVTTPTQRRHDDQFDVRIDQAIGDANRPFVRYSFDKSRREVPSFLPLGDGGVTGAGTYDITGQSVAINDTHVFGPRWLNELRVGWSAVDIGFVRVGSGRLLAEDLGIPGINRDEQTTGMVNVAFATMDMRSIGSGGGPGTANTSALQVTESLTHVRGRHMLKAGASLILRRRHVYFSDAALGMFGHNTDVTSSCAGRAPACRPDPTSGFSFASFMLGHPSVFNRSVLEAPYTERRPEWSAYLQDDFRMGDRLTLNLGLRWDLFVPYVEDDDRQSNFDTSQGRFVVASEDAVIGGVEVGRHLQTYAKTDFAPRVGVAYDLRGTGRTILRGGFGMFWNTPLTGTSSSKAQNPPFLLAQSLTNPSRFVPVVGLSSGSAPPTPATGGNSRSSFDPNFRDGYAQQWSLNIQQQLGPHDMFEIGYIGSRGRQLVVLVDVNQAPARVGVTNVNVNRPFFTTNPTLATVVQSTSAGTFDYHALQARVVRRLTAGLSTSAAYTFGKAIDLDSNTDGTTAFPNAYDLRYNRGPANHDVTHVFTATWMYALPFGRGGKLGGWQASGLVLARSGYPFTVFQSQNPSSTLTTALPGQLYRPDRRGSGAVETPTVDRWFDTGAFSTTTEPTAAFGDAGRNILRGPGQVTIDAAIVKVTAVGRLETELRLEAFNLLNDAAFANPVSTIDFPNAGRISSLMPFTPMRQLQAALKVRF